MCGIFFSYSQNEDEYRSDRLKGLLERRGPDSTCTVHRTVDFEQASSHGIAFSQPHLLTLCSTVLSLRGDGISGQPMEDHDTGSVLCWNGEAWHIGHDAVHGNDTQQVFDSFLKATRSTESIYNNPKSPYDRSMQNLVDTIASISGPYAFVFYDALYQRVIWGRDPLGRRSLTTSIGPSKSLIISSVCDVMDNELWTEVEADGIYLLDLRRASSSTSDGTTFIPRIPQGSTSDLPYSMRSPFQYFNEDSSGSESAALTLESSSVHQLSQRLQAAMVSRSQSIPLVAASTPDQARVAVLFSGGLDCSVLARLAHDFVPEGQAIDLLNVAFENPQVVRASANGQSPSTFSAYGLCPDRITGLNSFTELCTNCPGRGWRFVTIDISYEELQAHRATIIRLIHPHNTEMDFSIACALYFAARGSGTIIEPSTGCSIPYKTPARVLLSGLGADELFGGYTRHATAFTRRGYAGLVEELQLDFNRLGKRNLGRDDRVISHWGKEVRYPYLDEALVCWALSIPVWEKCGFRDNTPGEDNPVSSIEPAKKLLRLVAWKLGLRGAAVEKKRAIQFGARTAKMEAGKTKGTQTLT